MIRTTLAAYVRQHAPFFAEWAGVSYDPKTQTEEQGRQAGARKLAEAERHAIRAGWSYEWSVDPDVDSSDWCDERPAWKQWQCLLRDHEGRCIQSLHGIDFGRDGGPYSDPYARVVQAELALEAMP